MRSAMVSRTNYAEWYLGQCLRDTLKVQNLVKNLGSAGSNPAFCNQLFSYMVININTDYTDYHIGVFK